MDECINKLGIYGLIGILLVFISSCSGYKWVQTETLVEDKIGSYQYYLFCRNYYKIDEVTEEDSLYRAKMFSTTPVKYVEKKDAVVIYTKDFDLQPLTDGYRPVLMMKKDIYDIKYTVNDPEVASARSFFLVMAIVVPLIIAINDLNSGWTWPD